MPRDSDERIVLNVGGIKYTTTRSTLTSHPDTLLGRMFHQRNRDMLKSTHENRNEYYFDRNGRAFYYVIEFYRNNRIFWPCEDTDKGVSISRRELIAEFEYFGVPWDQESYDDLVNKPAANLLDNFIEALEKSIPVIISNYGLQFMTYFLINGQVRSKIEGVKNILNPYNKCGYSLLKSYGADIISYLNTKFPNLVFEVRLDRYKEFEYIDCYCLMVSETPQFLEQVKSSSIYLNPRQVS